MPETLMLIILSIVCKHDIKEVETNQIRFVKNKFRVWEHPREVDS